jgi:hypothetical protein
MNIKMIIAGAEPDNPHDWDNIYAEYCDLMNRIAVEGKTKLGVELSQFRKAFCLTDVGSQINLQYMENQCQLLSKLCR